MKCQFETEKGTVRMIRYLLLVKMVLVGAFVCGSNQVCAANFSATIAKDQSIKIGNGVEPKELDPAKATGAAEGNILENLFEGLTDLDPYTLQPVPGNAESWKISKDGRTYTFKLRPDLKWSDGKALTADDYVWSWRRVLAPATASEYAYQLYYLKNGKAFNEGKIKDPAQIGVKAVDNRTLEVVLEAPTSYFLQLTAFTTLYPTPRHVIEKFPDGKWTQEKNMVSNGPFALEEWKINKHIKLIPNNNYWDRSKVTLESVYLLPIENVNTEEKSFFAGEIQSTNSVPTAKIPKYVAEKSGSPAKFHPYRSDPYLGVYFYRFNVTKAPMDNVKVRKALNLAIDRQLIVEKVTQGGQKPAVGFTPENTSTYKFPGTLPPSLTPEALATAKRLLAEAGYPDGKGFPKINILYNTDESHKKVALAIQQMWKKNLGIEVGLFNQEWKVYLNSVTKLDYQIARAGWIGDYPDPNTFLDLFVSNGGNNNTGWTSKTYDKLISDASKESDLAKRFEIFRKAETILLEELPVLPIYFYTRTRLISEKVVMKNGSGELTPWTPNIRGRLFLKYYALAQ